MSVLKYKLFISLPLIAMILELTGCISKVDSQPEGKQAYVLPDSIANKLEIDSVVKTTVVKSINLTGKVGFNEDHVVKVFPLVSGISQDVKVELGDYVTAGQILAIIRSSEMAGFSTDLITAQTNVRVAKKSLEASEDMFKSGLISSKDNLAAQSAYEQAKASLLKAQRIISLNGGNMNGSMEIKAPINGFIVEKLLNNNMSIRADNSSSLFTISDLRNVWVTANVYESNIPYVKMGDSVEVTTISYPDMVFYGRVDKIMNVLDPTNKVMKVRIVLSNPNYLLKPEMYANVTVMTKAKGNNKMLCVPSKALIFDNSQYYVLVYKTNADIAIRPVIVATAAGEKTYIQDGLQEGERIIASNALLIYQQLNG